MAASNSLYTVPLNYDNKNLDPVHLDENCFLPIVDKFCYLGKILTRNCKDDADVVNRICKAGNAFGALRNCVLANSHISLAVKRSVYEGLVLPILLYGSETWCLTEEVFNLIRNFSLSMCSVNVRCNDERCF